LTGKISRSAGPLTNIPRRHTLPLKALLSLYYYSMVHLHFYMVLQSGKTPIKNTWKQ